MLKQTTKFFVDYRMSATMWPNQKDFHTFAILSFIIETINENVKKP